MKHYSITWLRTFSFIVIFSILSACSTEPDAPTPPDNNSAQPIKPLNTIPKGERIIFIKKQIKKIWLITDSIDVGTGDIWSMDPTGQNLLQHTDLSKDYFVTDHPKLSYNGRYLSFTSNYKSWQSACYTDIFRWDLQQNKIVRITGDEWPPDNPRSNFTTLKVLSLQKNMRISAKGSQNFTFPQTEVATDSGTYYRTYLKVPASTNIWVKAERSATVGDLVFDYMVKAGNNEVVLGPVNDDGSDGFVAICQKGQPNDEGKIVGMMNGKLIMYRENGQLIWEKNVGGHAWGFSDDPAWSHDGNRIAICLGATGYANLLAIHTPPESDQIPNPIFGDQTGNSVILSPSWAPNDENIIFCFSQIGGQGNVPNIYRISPDGTNLVKITNYSGYYAAVNPCYSPDGSKIVFTLLKCRVLAFNDFLDFIQTNIESANICIMNADGSNIQQLTNDGLSYNAYWGLVK